MTYLHRLQEREQMLHLKRQDLDDILRTHHYLQEQVERNRANEQHLKHGLASEYKQIME